jgi:hypothetical protein
MAASTNYVPASAGLASGECMQELCKSIFHASPPAFCARAVTRYLPAMLQMSLCVLLPPASTRSCT